MVTVYLEGYCKLTQICLSECNKHKKYQKSKQHVQRRQLVINLNKDEHSNGYQPQNHGNLGRQRSTSSGRFLFGDV